MRDARNIFSVVLALTLMQAGAGALAVVVPLTLAAAGANAIAIGAVAAAYALGFVAGATAAPRIIAALGHIRSFAAGAAIASALALALHLDDATYAWSILRFGAGACIALLFAAGESWIASAAPRQSRGALISFYHVLAKLGLIIGPFLVAGVAPRGAAGYMIPAALFALCLVPVAATRQTQPPAPSSEPYGPAGLFRIAPAAVIAAFMAGLVNGAVGNLAPIYAGRLDSAAPMAAAAAFNAVIMFGGVLSQWPAGWLSDRYDRRLIILGLAAVSAVASIGLALLPAATPEAIVLIVGFIWGAGAMSFYGVGVAHAADRSDASQSANMMAGLLMVWAVGSVAGPLLAGAAMATPIGAPALFWYAALGLAALAGAMVWRCRSEASLAGPDKSPYASSLATSVVAAELDPRTPYDENGEADEADEPPAREPEPARNPPIAELPEELEEIQDATEASEAPIEPARDEIEPIQEVESGEVSEPTPVDNSGSEDAAEEATDEGEGDEDDPLKRTD